MTTSFQMFLLAARELHPDELLGVDLPDDQVQGVIDAVKAKISVDKLGGMLGGLFGGKK